MSLPMEWKMINDAKFSLNNFMFQKKIIFKVISKKNHFIIQIMFYLRFVLDTKAKSCLCIYYDVQHILAFVNNFHQQQQSHKKTLLSFNRST